MINPTEWKQIVDLINWNKSDTITQDSQNRNVLQFNSFENSYCRIASGTIIETCPEAHAYKVNIGIGHIPLLCCSLQTGGGNPSLLYDSSFYSVGTNVLVAITGQIGVILGAIPLEGDASNLIFHNITSNSSQNYPDTSDQACLSLSKDEYVGIKDFGNGLPEDTTDVGEFGHSTTTGVKMMMNPFMALMAVDDYTGMWVFDEDSLLRLSGINIQVRTTGRENEYFNDNGEYIEYLGSSVYPWEQLGCTKPPTEDLIKESEEKEWREPGTWKSYVEPSIESTSKHAKPYHRITQYGGWLGQGKYTQITAPDPDSIWTTYNDPEKLQGLIRLSESLDGWISSIAASNTFIGKKGLIPTVSRVNRPDDTSTEIGDNNETYSSTNKFDIPAEIPSSKPMDRIMGLEDSIAYQQNFKELFTFLQHKKDYYVPEDSELNEGMSRFADFSQLAGKNLIAVDGEKKVTVVDEGGDITKREITVNAAEAGIATLNDGSEVLYGGCGEEIRMTGGSIFMDAPGDIWIKSGRKVILWAGDDIEIRAKGHIDVSTTEGSVRIKAENQLSMRGGNNEKGGVIIESKSKGDDYDFSKPGENAQFSGMILKSAGTIATLGSTLYMRSGVDDTGRGIFIDANSGDQPIYTLSNNNINYVENNYVLNYTNLTTGEVNATTKFNKDYNDISGSITVTGTGVFTDSVSCGDSYYAVGHIFTGDAPSYNLEVGDYSSNKDRLRDNIEEAEERVKEENPESNQETYNNAIQSPIYELNKIGNEDTIKGAEFSFRNDYNVPDDFAVYESRWQNIGENAHKGGTPWEEKAVISEVVEETYPFPGKDYYTGIPCYVTQAWTLTDYDTGLYKNRWKGDDANDDYKNPKYGEQQKKTLNEYPVIG